MRAKAFRSLKPLIDKPLDSVTVVGQYGPGPDGGVEDGGGEPDRPPRGSCLCTASTSAPTSAPLLLAFLALALGALRRR